MNYTKLSRVISVAFVASVYSAHAPAQHSFCTHQIISLCPGCDTFTTIRVRTGKVCEIRYLSFHRLANIGNIPTAIYSQKVVVRPHGGIYGTANLTFGAYMPNPGFVGIDSFQVDIEFESGGQRHVTRLKANVNVVP